MSREAELLKLRQKLMNSPYYDEYVEYGGLLLKPIDELTPAERKRYEELREILTQNEKG